MKIILKQKNKIVFSIDEVNSTTMLREIKRIYEREAGIGRSQYFFAINGMTGNVNDNTNTVFFDYLQSIHQVSANKELTINIVNLRTDTRPIHHRDDIIRLDHKANINNEKAAKLICPIEQTLISGLPVEINGRYYNYESFLEYILEQKRKYTKATIKNIYYELVCPFRIPLPLFLVETIKNNQEDVYINHALDRVFEECCETYEDEISDFKKSLSEKTNLIFDRDELRISEQITDSSPLFLKPLQVTTESRPDRCCVIL